MDLNNLLKFDKSMGYDCKKLNNLCRIKSNILVYVSGNLIHFFNIDTKDIETYPSSGGQGISFVTRNPNVNFNYLTVAENGCHPAILIYNYPDMSIISKCENGTERKYSCINYNSTGEFLVSQGHAPDFTLTVWDWRTSNIIHRTRSADIDVLNVVFSQHNGEQLVTGGVGHIQFWSMRETFTGMKLNGIPGRFGQADVCDIMGLCALPDRKILSNSAWGSILVWTDGHIKFEVCQKNRKPCHQRDITQILYDNGDVWTIGKDGYVRVWFWKTVDLAEVKRDDPFIEADPTYEYRIGTDEHSCELLSIVRGEEENCWYAQDGNGGIFKCDLAPAHNGRYEMLFRCHAGGIVGVVCCPFSEHMVTLGIDGRCHLYNYTNSELLCFHQFPAGGRDLIWVPNTVDPSGIIIIMAFDDGVIRMVCIDLISNKFHLVQVIKSHNAPVNRLLLSESTSILISGSDDSTVFVHQIVKHLPYIRIRPIGLVKMSSTVTALEWNSDKASSVFVGCSNGELIEVHVPKKPKSYDDITYALSNIESRTISLDIKSSQSHESTDSDKKSAARILWLKHSSKKTVYVSLGGDCAGFIHEFDFRNGRVIRLCSIEIDPHTEITSILKLTNHIILGLSNGKMIAKYNLEMKETESESHITNLHDSSYGVITSICTSFDQKYLISVGLDGNIFVFTLNSIGQSNAQANLPTIFGAPNEIHDIIDPAFLSLEDQKKQSYRDERIRFVNDKKSEMLEVLRMLKDDFATVRKQNDLLPESQKLSAEELELDDRITNDMEMDFSEQMDLVRRKMAFEVEKTKLLKNKVENFLISHLECWPIEVTGIRNEAAVQTFRIAKTSDEFFAIKADLEATLAHKKEVRNSLSNQTANRLIDFIDSSTSEDREIHLTASDSFLQNLIASTDESKFDLQMKRLLKKYSERKFEEAERKKMWEYINSMIPDPNVLDPNDIEALKMAKENIGNYKLKTDSNFVPTEDDIFTATKKFRELLCVKEEIHSLRNDYNQIIFDVREEKVNRCKYIQHRMSVLAEIHKELPANKWRTIDPIQSIGDDKKYAETKMKIMEVCSVNIGEDNKNNPKSRANLNFSTTVLNLLQTTDYNVEGTSWNKDFQTIRQTEKLFEQERIIQEITQNIDSFDQKIIALKKTRFEIEIKAKFLELYFLTIYQELWILRDFEEIEAKLLTKINGLRNKSEEIQLEHLSEKTKMDNLVDNANGTKDEIAGIKAILKRECAGNKHEKCLLKAFRINSVGSSLSESSNEDGDHSEDFETDMKDINKTLFELMSSLRHQRILLQKRLRKEMGLIEKSHTKMVKLKNTSSEIETSLNVHKEELNSLTQDKQNMLNEVETLIVLRLDQLQYFASESELYEIEETVLVNHDTISKLYQRVGQLAVETIDEQRKHRIYKMHLARMKTDCNFMNNKILHLKDDTNNIMSKRFGLIIDLDEMEESILKKCLLNSQGSAEAIDNEYQKKANELKKIIVQKEIEFLKVKQERIEKMHVLTALQEEKNMLEESICYQSKVQMKLLAEPPIDLDVDLSKLKEICQQQQDQLKILKKEIQTLRLKAKPFDSAPPSLLKDGRNQFYRQISDDASQLPTRSASQVSTIADETNNVHRIATVVERFLVKCIAMHMDTASLKAHGRKISIYLSQVISNYVAENNDEITRCVAENLKGFLPKKALRYIQTRDLAKLFNEVVQMFSNNDDDFTIDELLENILSELKTKVARDSPDYTGTFVCEFLEDIFAVLPLEDVSKEDRVKEIANALRKVTDLDPKQIDTIKMVAEVSAYFGNSLGNNMDKKELKRFIEDLIKQLLDISK